MPPSHSPAGCLLNPYLSTSTNGGIGFGKQLLVSSGPTHPNINFGGTFIGDYNGVAATVHAVQSHLDRRSASQAHPPRLSLQAG